MSHTLTERAMTLNLSVGMWAGYRLDRAASQQVTEDAGADRDAARVNKHLIPKELLKPIVTAMNAIRAHFYTKTLPWRDNGDRLLTRMMFTSFVPDHQKLVAEFDDAVAHFLDNEYPGAIAKAEFRMGTMFNRDDYPPVNELRRRFYATLDIGPIGTAGDFRVELDEENATRIRSDIEAATESRLRSAVGDVWARMAKAVGYFQERMADPKATFRASTVENIDELLDLIPGLNVLDDENIETVRAAIAKSLGGLDPEDLRKDASHRAEKAGEAEKIMSKMEGFMKAFGAEVV